MATVHGMQRLVALTLVAVALLASSCAGDDADDAALIAAAVHIEAMGCHRRPTVGAGSFMAKDRVLTVAHVVAGSTDVQVVLSDGSRRSATVMAMDRKKDLAVLRVDADVEPLIPGRARAGDRGEFVVRRDDRSVEQEVSIVTFVDINAMDIDHTGPSLRKGFQITASVDHGDSGSVLVTADRAVGVVFARSTGAEGRAWATDIREAAPLLSVPDGTVTDVGECAG